MNINLTTEKLSSEQNAKFSDALSRMTGGIHTHALDMYLPIIEQIRELKREHNAVVLSHYYMPPFLQITEAEGGIADFVGDSLGLSLEAARSKADYIIFCGVKFMAETARILNPDKTVLLPNHDAGCSLAESITAADVRLLKETYPGAPVVAYVNTYAETKAEADICCTSRNALAIAASFKSEKIIFLPDLYMGRNLATVFRKNGDKDFILWSGSCEVHEQFNQNIEDLTENYPEADVLLHWEVPDCTVSKYVPEGKGMVGSTSDILSYVKESSKRQFILGSECDLAATLKGMFPDRSFVTPCIVCNHMKKIQLQNTLDALSSIGTEKQDRYEIHIEKDILHKAYLPLKRMLDFV